MIKNIIFDVGKVLVEFDWRKVLENLQLEEEVIERVADATVRSEIWNEYDRSLLNDEEILDAFIANDSEIRKEITLFWNRIGDTIFQYSYANSWVKSFKEKGYKCYILSNYARRTYELTKEELSFENLMDGVLFSYQVKQVKPEKEIFDTLLEKFQLKAEECVFVDDNSANVDMARELGIHGIQFFNLKQVEDELKELGVE